METIITSTTAEAKLNQIPPGFKLLAKEELAKEIKQLNPSLTLDPDKTYVNIAQGTTIFSETLTEALLKKTIKEINLLSDNLAGLYAHPGSVNPEDQIKGLNPADIRNTINRLSTTLVNNYYEQADNFWKSNKIPTPQELQDNPVNNLLQALAENSSLIERVYQLNAMYPNLKQSVVSYFSKKLRGLYKKDIHPDTVRVLFFSQSRENSNTPFLNIDLISFTLNYFRLSCYLLGVTLQVKVSQNAKNTALSDILQESDILTIKSNYQKKLELFWQKNVNNYRVLAKFSFLKTLFKQQNSTFKLSKEGFEIACQASLGFSQEEIIELDEMDFTEPSNLEDLFISNPLEISLLLPSHIEVSPFLINNHYSTDILKIHDLETNNLLLYIPGYTPSFIEAKDERLLRHWVFHQTQLSQANFSAIAAHFPHSSRMISNHKLDAFLYENYTNQEETITGEVSQEDVFSFITERQKARTIADLYVDGVPVPIPFGSTPNYQSTDSAFFTTIVAAIEYPPYLLPSIHDTSSDLHELFPTPYQTASELIKEGIKDKLGLDIDPDNTFIRFSLHETSPIYYDPTLPSVSRGQKASTTIQSFTEATLNNYRVGYSPFGYTTIIYQDPSGKGEYRSSDQLLNILPQDVEEIIEQADLDTVHKNKLLTFWSAYADRVKYFIKHRYLQQALEAYHNKTLSEETFKIISEAAFHALALEEGESPNLINPHISIEIISVDSYQSTDMFLFRDTSQQKVILYIAGNKEAFYPFANYAECICFLENNARKDVTWQKLLSSHFSMDVQDSVLSSLQRGPYIPTSSLVSVSFLPSACSFENSSIQHPITTKPIEKSFFDVMQTNIEARSYLNANVVITSDKEIRIKQLINIAESIKIALLIPSIAFPILNWVALAALATETSLNLYIAKTGDTVQERHQAAIDAGITSVEFLLLAAFVSLRSLKFSKNQNLSEETIQDQMKSRPLTGGSGGSGLSPTLKKAPVSEEVFFGGAKSMQVWNIVAPDRQFNHLDVKAWFVGEQFLLFTGQTDKANHLIISSDGGYFPGSGIVKVPKNTDLVVLGPHGSALVDPRTSNIAKKLVLPYGIITEHSAVPTQTAHFPSLFSRSSNTHLHPKTIDVKILAGTNVPGHIKNYSLAKYQKFGTTQESYLDLVHVINHSRHPSPNIYQIGVSPVDVLTVRNRRGRLLPNLKDVFTSLERNGIHYDRITLEFCRSNMFSSRANPLSIYKPARF